jgi:hypothetical protein
MAISLPPSTDGEWWELSDESRGGIPYYYHTKTSETVWERPEAFVIPLGALQVSLRWLRGGFFRSCLWLFCLPTKARRHCFSSHGLSSDCTMVLLFVPHFCGATIRPYARFWALSTLFCVPLAWGCSLQGDFMVMHAVQTSFFRPFTFFGVLAAFLFICPDDHSVVFPSQNSALGRRLSMVMPASGSLSLSASDSIGPAPIGTDTMDMHSLPPSGVSTPSSSPSKPSASISPNGKVYRRSRSYDQHHPTHHGPSWAGQLPPIPGSPYATSVEGSSHGHDSGTPLADTDISKVLKMENSSTESSQDPDRDNANQPGGSISGETPRRGDVDVIRHPSSSSMSTSLMANSKPKPAASPSRSRANTVHSPIPHRSKSQPSMSLAHAQSLGAAVEYITAPPVPPLPPSTPSHDDRASSDSGHGNRWRRNKSREREKEKSGLMAGSQPRRSLGVPRWTRDPQQQQHQAPNPPPSPSLRRPAATTATSSIGIKGNISGREIGMPVLDVRESVHLSYRQGCLDGVQLPNHSVCANEPHVRLQMRSCMPQWKACSRSSDCLHGVPFHSSYSVAGCVAYPRMKLPSIIPGLATFWLLSIVSDY